MTLVKRIGIPVDVCACMCVYLCVNMSVCLCAPMYADAFMNMCVYTRGSQKAISGIIPQAPTYFYNGGLSFTWTLTKSTSSVSTQESTHLQVPLGCHWDYKCTTLHLAFYLDLHAWNHLPISQE